LTTDRSIGTFATIDRSVKPTVEAANTAARIHDAALRLFAARGYAATGIREIARDAGVTTAGLYHHMGNKQDLLVTIMRDTMHGLIAEARTALAETESAPAQLAGLARAHVTYNGEHLLEALVGDTEIRSLEHANRPRIIKLRDSYEELWADVIARGLENGEFRIGDQKLFRLAVIQMCNSVSYWYTPAGPTPLRVIADEFAEYALAMAGCAPEQGRGPAGSKKARSRR
jgi:AcrR family transcriptional regulator